MHLDGEINLADFAQLVDMSQFNLGATLLVRRGVELRQVLEEVEG
ncbi:hypothetical protein RintRC_0947 [Richelia intracellularis]|nr:hypothetical protein RintRC_0947 [Richelia intracellularis]